MSKKKKVSRKRKVQAPVHQMGESDNFYRDPTTHRLIRRVNKIV